MEEKSNSEILWMIEFHGDSIINIGVMNEMMGILHHDIDIRTIDGGLKKFRVEKTKYKYTVDIYPIASKIVGISTSIIADKETKFDLNSKNGRVCIDIKIKGHNPFSSRKTYRYYIYFNPKTKEK